MSNTLSLCLICKNEEKNIGNLLESVKGSLFDEIVVVDSVPEHVPVLIQNTETGLIDIISFKSKIFLSSNSKLIK